MDEEKKVTQNEEKSKGHKAEEKPGLGQRLSTWFKNIMGEFKKIIWPSREELIKETVTVIVTSLVVGAVICGYDVIFHYGYNFLTTLVSR